MKLDILLGNAFIELFYSDKPMSLTRNQLFKYADAVTKERNDFVDLSGASMMDLKLNHDKEFEFGKDGLISTRENVTVIDLEARYRSNISTPELNALTSLNAKRALGIIPPFIKRHNYL